MYNYTHALPQTHKCLQDFDINIYKHLSVKYI